MNCCDYNCNQGRNCPARKPVTVAKVGKRMQGPEPLHASPWRAYLKYLAAAMLVVVASFTFSAAVVALIF